MPHGPIFSLLVPRSSLETADIGKGPAGHGVTQTRRKQNPAAPPTRPSDPSHQCHHHHHDLKDMTATIQGEEMGQKETRMGSMPNFEMSRSSGHQHGTVDLLDEGLRASTPSSSLSVLAAGLRNISSQLCHFSTLLPMLGNLQV